jgi:imidazolonepropionase-like amidohydrolase
MRNVISTGAIGLLCASAVLAQSPQSPSAASLVVLKAAHLFDGRTGQLQSPGMLVVQGERIVAVGSGSQIPAGAQVLDLGDATLLPGFIDAHSHIASDYHDNWAQGFYEDTMRFPGEAALHAARNARDEVMAGVTTARVVGARNFIDVSLRNAIKDGITDGPRLLVAGHAIGSTGGHCDASPVPPDVMPPPGPLEGVCNGPEQCREAVRQQMKYGADVIKICASGGVLSEADPVDVPQLTPAELSAIVSEAHAWRRKVAAHCHGDFAAKQAIEAGVDSIEHGSFLQPATLQLMKQKGTYLVPTRMTVLWVVDKAQSFPPKIRDKALAAGAADEAMLHNAIKMGVAIAYGTDSAVFPHGLNAREFGDYVDLGMTPAAALMTSSLGSARLLGIDADTGTLEKGKYADVVAVPGDVLQNVRATEKPLFVMKQGKVVRNGPT